MLKEVIVSSRSDLVTESGDTRPRLAARDKPLVFDEGTEVVSGRVAFSYIISMFITIS